LQKGFTVLFIDVLTVLV